MCKTSYILLFFLFVLGIEFEAQGQESNPAVAQHLLILGNLERLTADDPIFDQLDELIAQQQGEVVVLIAGDFVDKDGLELDPTELEISKLKRLMKLGDETTQLLFIPGDREWDEGRRQGLKKVKAIEDYFKDFGEERHYFLTEDGCPGPEIIDIGKTLRIVALNTHWFVHEYKRPEEQDADCDLLNEAELWEEIEDVIRSDDNRNIVITSHHPVLSYGQYAGYRLVKQHFLPPIVGSFIAGYHQNVGGIKDLAQLELNAYSDQFEDLFERYDGLIYASGHEYDIQLNAFQGNYHVNSGALEKRTPTANGEFNEYRQKQRGIAQLRFFEDGAVDMLTYIRNNEGVLVQNHQEDLFVSACKPSTKKLPENDRYLPCRDKLFPLNSSSDPDAPTKGTAIAGIEYEAGFMHRMFIGKHYRKAWTTPVNNIPYLDLDTTAGGLIAYAKGGAAQTRSVRFKSKDGQVFAFRSVNKDPTQKQDKDFKTGIIADVFKDITSSQHPYAGNILTPLMAIPDIPNPEAELYLLPDHPKLGPFRKEFKGMLGWLEKRPKSKKKGRKPYRDADKVVSTVKMRRKMIEDNDYQMNDSLYLQARLFDMWVADWDRHTKNWSWLGYGDKKDMVYHPWPKDRDKALTRMDGIFRVLDWPMISRDMYRFRKSLRGLKSLNFKSRNMDRLYFADYSKEDILRGTRQFQSIMTDEKIDSSVMHLPKEVYEFDGPTIAKTLKVRRDGMQKMMKRYYRMMAKIVHFVGSNKDEIFEVNRLENGDVKVALYDKKKNGSKGKLLQERVCRKSETKEIQLFGLGGQDDFNIDGKVKKSILVRIVGGKSSDRINDNSHVSGLKKHTKHYDHKGKDEVEGGKEYKLMHTPEEISFEVNNFFNYDYPIIVPLILYNKDDGYVFRVTGQTTFQKFNKPGFGSQYNLDFQWTTLGKFNVRATANYRHVLDEWDLRVSAHAGNPDFLFPRFFGLGNESTIVDSLLQQGFYDNEMESYNFVLGLSRRFWDRSLIDFRGIVEYHDVNPNSQEELGRSIYDFYPDDITTTLAGARVHLDLDFRDDAQIPTRGIHLTFINYSFLNENLDWKPGGRTRLHIASFWPVGNSTNLTLAVKAGGSVAYGKTPFYFKSFIGQTENLRGYRRNRFSGDQALYLNSELRWHAGRIQTRLAPFYWGLLAFTDVGRTFLGGETSDIWHPAVGGGFYIIPYDIESFNLVVTVAHSKEEDALVKFGVGFYIR